MFNVLRKTVYNFTLNGVTKSYNHWLPKIQIYTSYIYEPEIQKDWLDLENTNFDVRSQTKKQVMEQLVVPELKSPTNTQYMSSIACHVVLKHLSWKPFPQKILQTKTMQQKNYVTGNEFIGLN